MGLKSFFSGYSENYVSDEEHEFSDNNHDDGIIRRKDHTKLRTFIGALLGTIPCVCFVTLTGFDKMDNLFQFIGIFYAICILIGIKLMTLNRTVKISSVIGLGFLAFLIGSMLSIYSGICMDYAKMSDGETIDEFSEILEDEEKITAVVGDTSDMTEKQICMEYVRKEYGIKEFSYFQMFIHLWKIILNMKRLKIFYLAAIAATVLFESFSFWVPFIIGAYFLFYRPKTAMQG